MFNGCLDGIDDGNMVTLDNRIREFIQNNIDIAANAALEDKVRMYRDVANYYMLYQAFNEYICTREKNKLDLDAPIGDIVASLWDKGGW